jgi:L-ribulokinase
MADKRFSLGLDFGTESARAVIVDVRNGDEVATAVHEYRHGVIDEKLPATGQALEPDWAIQHAGDYLEALADVVPKALKQAGITGEQIVGIGVDFTSCTMMPIDAQDDPLCLDPKWASNPHAYVKLWKHHAAQPEADRINQLARERKEPFLARYGGIISSEWFFPKVLQILNEAPEVYDATDRFIEGADWAVLRLTGQERRSACTAGYKAMWDKEEGFPSPDYFAALHPKMRNVVDEKMKRDIHPMASRAGVLTEAVAAKTGLVPGIPVAVGIIDAHSAVPAATIADEGQMLMIMGTSTCHMVLTREKHLVEGISGVVADGILPGFYGYEAGQVAVGDIFAWFVNNSVPAEYAQEAAAKGKSLHEILADKARAQRPGEHGLLALDWWNGNRTPLVDADLSGLLLGCTLQTRPEDIYRALVEATAFGTRLIIETYRKFGVPVNELYACGGLVQNELLMQIYADVTNLPMRVARSTQASAAGAAIFGSVAAGKEHGGYDSMTEAIARMGGVRERAFLPNAEAAKVYDRIYKDYLRLLDYFGRGENPVMKSLKRLRLGQT